MKNLKYSLEITKKRVASIKESIGNKRALSRSDKNWLNSQKLAYKKDATKFSKSKLILIDSLIPLLGYDWKEGRNFLEQLQKKKVDEIYQLLAEKKPLPNKLKNWLYHQQNIYHKQPDKLDKKLISLLDSLTPVLGRNWKERFRPSEVHSNKMLSKLSSAIKSKREPDKKIISWLREQRYQYNNNPKGFKKSTKQKLDALIPLMGYDWKEFKRKSGAMPFKQRVAKIKDKLQKKQKLDYNDQRWLARNRNKYREDQQALTLEQIDLLNTLNTLLKTRWQEYAKTKPEKIKSYEIRVKEIKMLGVPYNLLPKAEKDYLQKQRKKYLRNKKDYPLKKLAALNSLNTILGHDWKKFIKKQKKPIPFDKRIKIIRNKLQAKRSLSFDDKSFLARYRKRYHTNAITLEKIEILNTLNPLLGYDWKDTSLLRAKSKTFKQQITAIRETLENGKEISVQQKKWLYYQRSQYHNDPSNYLTSKITMLNELNPLLKRDWKLRSKKIRETLSFQESLVKIRQRLITGKELTEKQKTWLSTQRFYLKKNDSKLTENKKTSLDSLNILLGYDWKTYKHERDNMTIINR